MARTRICFLWLLHHCTYFPFRRILAHTRRPYLILGIGVLLLLVTIASLDSGRGSPTGPSAARLMERRLRDMQRKIQPGGFKIKTPASNSNAVYFRYSDLAAIQAERQERLRQVCQRKTLQAKKRHLRPEETRYHEGWYSKKFHYNVMEVYQPQRFFFCPVLKVGSTFFRRLFYALSTGKSIGSPYDVSIVTALKAPREHLDDVEKESSARASGKRSGDGRSVVRTSGQGNRSQPTQHQPPDPAGAKRVEDFLANAGKVMFTREPYSKLLSGYIDKLFAPNPYFWNVIGRFIIQKFRKYPSLRSLECGHDVTFTEFIKYVIENERTNKLKRDTHFVPSYDQCKPCDYHYDVIGKMETFSADASLVLAQLGHNVSQSTLEDWSRAREYDAIEDSVTSPYSWRREVTKCMTWEEANQRIWRKLQIRGILNRREPLPMSDFKQYSTHAPSFIQVCKKYWERFRTSALKSEQKRDALSSAYSFISRDDLELVREYFLLDFDLFGYESRPATIHKAGNRTWAEVFDVYQ